jgi:hypothetical protein
MIVAMVPTLQSRLGVRVVTYETFGLDLDQGGRLLEQLWDKVGHLVSPLSGPFDTGPVCKGRLGKVPLTYSS